MDVKREVNGFAAGLFFKTILLAARWAGVLRRRTMEQFFAMGAEEAAREILALRDRVHQLETLLAIVRKQARSGESSPRYSIRERLFILWQVEYFQIPRRRVEEYFGIARSTLYRWLHRIEAEATSQAEPPNKTPSDLAALVWEVAKANAHWGRVRIARQIALLGVFLSASAVRNILNRPRPHEPSCARIIQKALIETGAEDPPRSIPAWYPNHVWSVDLTVVDRWLFWPTYVLVAIDHFSRAIVAAVPLEGPNSGWTIDALEEAIGRFGKPKHLITDQGSVFKSEAFKGFLERWGVKHRFGAVGKHGSIAVTERAILTLKYEWLNRVPLIKGFDHLSQLCEEFCLWYNTWRPHQAFPGEHPEDRRLERHRAPPPRTSKTLPLRIERRHFREAHVTGFRLKACA